MDIVNLKTKLRQEQDRRLERAVDFVYNEATIAINGAVRYALCSTATIKFWYCSDEFSILVLEQVAAKLRSAGLFTNISKCGIESMELCISTNQFIEPPTIKERLKQWWKALWQQKR